MYINNIFIYITWRTLYNGSVDFIAINVDREVRNKFSSNSRTMWYTFVWEPGQFTEIRLWVCFQTTFGAQTKREKKGERKKERGALFDRHLSDSRARYTQREATAAFKGNLLMQYREPRISVRNESLVLPDDTRASSIARTDSPAKPRGERANRKAEV